MTVLALRGSRGTGAVVARGEPGHVGGAVAGAGSVGGGCGVVIDVGVRAVEGVMGLLLGVEVQSWAVAAIDGTSWCPMGRLVPKSISVLFHMSTCVMPVAEDRRGVGRSSRWGRGGAG